MPLREINDNVGINWCVRSGLPRNAHTTVLMAQVKYRADYRDQCIIATRILVLRAT